MSLFAALVVAVAACALPASASAQDARPNVVLVVTDDQTQESVRVMNGVERLLAARGTRFERAFSTFPLCCPSRATLLTGQYAHNHGVIHNAGPTGGYPRLDHGNALPVWLQRTGYRTIQLGRYLNGYGTAVDGLTIPPGWSDWNASVDPTTFDYSSWNMNENGRIRTYPGSERPFEHQNDFYARRVSEVVHESAPLPGPFFLQFTLSAPHSGNPRDPDDPEAIATPSPAARHRDAFAGQALPRPPSFDEADVADKPALTEGLPRLAPDQVAAIEENYRQELESLLSVDDAVVSLVNALTQTGELENTLIIYTSDNGFMHGEHRLPSSKVVPYEASTRVPLIMRGPGIPDGRRERRLVANVDVVPTILDVANVPPGRRQDGRSLLPLLADRTREPGREILLENGAGANGVIAYRGLRNQRYLYVNYYTAGEEELYDLRRDPFELRNLANNYRLEPLRAALARRTARLSRCRGSSCRSRPRLGLIVRGPTRRARRVRRCATGDLVVRVVGADARTLDRTEAFVGRRRQGRARRAPFEVRVRHRHLSKRRLSRLRVRATTRDGRVLTLDRRLAACG